MADAVFTQLPGTLGLAFVRGDEVTFSADFPGVDLTNYTVSAKVYTAARGDVTIVTTPTTTKTVTTTNGVTTSTVQVSLTETQTEAISAVTTTRWYLRWVSPGNVTRTVVSGQVLAQNP